LLSRPAFRISAKSSPPFRAFSLPCRPPPARFADDEPVGTAALRPLTEKLGRSVYTFGHAVEAKASAGLLSIPRSRAMHGETLQPMTSALQMYIQVSFSEVAPVAIVASALLHFGRDARAGRDTKHI